MTAPDEPTPHEPASHEPTPRERAARRRRLAEVFGDVLPEQTTDDAAEPEARPEGNEEWLRRQVPPHHGS